MFPVALEMIHKSGESFCYHWGSKNLCWIKNITMHSWLCFFSTSMCFMHNGDAWCCIITLPVI